MKIRLYLDEDSMRLALIVALRARGVDVQSALGAGMIARSDEEHLQYAAADGRVLYSFNVGDFYHLHKRWQSLGRSHAGIVLAQQQKYSVGEQCRRLLRLISTMSAEEISNQVVFLSGDDG